MNGTAEFSFHTTDRLRQKKFKLLGLHGVAKATACAQRGIDAFRKLAKKSAKGMTSKKQSAEQFPLSPKPKRPRRKT